jgi:hypothetical protein
MGSQASGCLDLNAINSVIQQAKESKIYGPELSKDKYWRICKYCKQTRGNHHNSFCKVDNTGKKFKEDPELTKISTAIYILYGGHIP